MMRMMRSTLCRLAVLMPGLLLALEGCKQSSAAPGAAPDAAGIVASSSYVLVTQNRPESLEKYLAFSRNVYALCASSADLRHEAVKPFPSVPLDFIDTRTTYASDGQRVVKREELYMVDFVDDEKHTACEMRVMRTSAVYISGGGRQQSSEMDVHGKVTVSEPEVSLEEPVRTSLLGQFTIPRIANGVQLKCGADNHCIVDPAVLLVTDAPDPVHAAWRIEGLPTYGTAAILEPISLSVGKPVDPSLFALDHK
jgi:hypothetical protein